MRELEERRRALLLRCDEQRAELAYRLEQIRPSTQVAEWTQRAPSLALNNPLAWLAALAGVATLLRPRRLVSWLAFATKAMALVSRATALFKLFSTLRSLRSGFR
jgi:hypothetical protein